MIVEFVHNSKSIFIDIDSCTRANSGNEAAESVAFSAAANAFREFVSTQDFESIVDSGLLQALAIFSELSKLSINEVLKQSRSSVLKKIYRNLYESFGMQTSTNFECRNDEVVVKGGYCELRKGGLYRDVRVYDMVSMYPSVMIAFNLGPNCTRLTNEESDVCIGASQYVQCVGNADVGVLAKSQLLLRQLKSNAECSVRRKVYKSIANSAYGLACNNEPLFGGKVVAAAVTEIARSIMQALVAYCEEKHLDFIYGDTDSIFVVGDIDTAEALKCILKEKHEHFELKLENSFKYFIQGKCKTYAALTDSNGIVVRGVKRPIRTDYSFQKLQSFEINTN
ncbi:DNA polymerase-like protein [Leptotrombidium deliense]|uniref:DNA-directed DNA polymerase n=1 Tax=Leptotrombidium deliense TaxID=299467 RepID=A0A443SLN2_9ACAR|nr:DNA polymerase-like protein [Leptotrombidium deliense]